jgi:hypothetical protein
MAAKRRMKVVFEDPAVLLQAKLSFWKEGSSIVFALAVPMIPASDNLLTAFRLEVITSRRTCAPARY